MPVRSSSFPLRRLAALLAAPTLIGAAAGAAVVAAPAAAPAATAAIGQCPPGFLPGPGNTNPPFTDNNVAVYAGGDFLADGSAAESEGLNVIMGDATYAKSGGGRFNVGTVGVGSNVTPTPGTVMLAVGGALTVGSGTVLDVGAGASDGGGLAGGSVDVGGATGPAYPDPAAYELNNGTMSEGLGAAAVADWSGFGASLAAASASWRTLADTGTATASGARVDFAGDGTSTRQVFTLTAAQLDGKSEFFFTGIPSTTDTTVIINVTGAGPLAINATYFANDGVRADDLGGTLFGQVSQRTMWNFADATAVSFGGASQFLGSVAAPVGSYDITASMNGRVYAGGDIHMHGSGNELHNYPWNDQPFDCVPEVAPTGSITLQKMLADGTEEFLPTDDEGRLPKFSGRLVCSLQPGGIAVEEWTLRPPATITIDGLPIGASCVITEDTDATAQDLDGREDVPLGLAWEEPSWTLNGEPVAAPVTFTVPDPDGEQRVALTVTNALSFGAFQVVKSVSNPAGLAFDDAFAGDWTCTAAGAEIASGRWQASSTAPDVITGIPVGATCVVTEDAPAAVDGAQWSSRIDPEGGVVVTAASEESPVTVTVENTLTADAGAFTIRKDFEPGQSGFTGSFTIDYVCTGPDGAPSGTVTLTAGQTSAPIVAPVGAECAASEPRLPAAPSGWEWGAPTISAPVTITASSGQAPLTITVSNTLRHDLPATGGTVPWMAIGAAGVLVASGSAALLIGARRRRTAD